MLQLFQAILLETYIVVVVHVIYSDDSVIGMGLAVFFTRLEPMNPAAPVIRTVFIVRVIVLGYYSFLQTILLTTPV